VTDPAAARVALRDWVVRCTGRIGAADLRDDTPLLTEGILTSIDVMELLLELERLRGAPVDVRRIEPGSFHSIDAIVAQWLESADG
jgi:hypothetical protein